MHIALNKPNQLVVGLTGGIGSGKTAVSNRLQTLGATVIDTDEIAHSLTKAGGLAMPDIQRAFGHEALLPDGSMNRDHMRALVFKEPEQRIALEKILHPKIRQLVQQQLDAGAPLYFVLVVPLLFEKGGWRRCHMTVVVSAPYRVQRARVLARPGMTPQKFAGILKGQMPDREKRALADVVIETGRGRRETWLEVKQLVDGL